MTTWMRVDGPAVVRCGCCGDAIPLGDLVCVFTRPPAKWKLFRCSRFACCGEAIPEQLPEPRSRPTAPPVTPFTRFTRGMLPLDFKQRAGGE